MWFPPLASNGWQNITLKTYPPFHLTEVHDRLTGHLRKRQWIHPKNLSCCSGIGGMWASCILRSESCDSLLRCPWSSWTDPRACGSFMPLLGFPVWLQGPEDLNTCHPDLIESQAALPCIHLELPANLRTESCFTSLQLWQDCSHLTRWRMKAGS